MQIAGILPSAGHGMRMRPLRYPKELLPVWFEKCGEDGAIKPRLAIENSIYAFKNANIHHCYIVIPDWKPEIMRYLGDGEQYDMQFAYLHNSKAQGLADAVFSGYPWLKNNITCLALPDTYFFPCNAPALLLEKLSAEKADLVLGVFPTQHARFLAPVEIENNGLVIRIEEKPIHPRVMNTWGLAVWRPSFWEFLKIEIRHQDPGVSITDLFSTAIENNLRVIAVYFDNGSYTDIGRYEDYPTGSVIGIDKVTG